MRNLKLNPTEVKDLPRYMSDAESFIEAKDHTIVLKNQCVNVYEKSEIILTQHNIETIDWITLDNLLYMGNGKLFKCYNLGTKELVDISVPNGYLVHKWSPLEDRVVFVTEVDEMRLGLIDGYVPNCTFITKYDLKKKEESPFVDVGWGSGATQFHGKQGRIIYTQAQRIENSVKNKDKPPTIAWREDAEMFAVSFVHENCRVFKIFSGEGEFLYENEFKYGLYAAMVWRPDGNVIACAQYYEDNYGIVFFEKIGLYHADLRLLNNIPVRKIEWNQIGDILAVWQHKFPNTNELTLWICRNNKWYMKQSLIFKEDEQVYEIKWDENKCLKVFTSKGVIRYNWRLEPDVSNIVQKDNNGLIFVIDRNKLKVTVTAISAIPPPYCSYCLDCDSAINFVVFSSDSNHIAVILNNYKVQIFRNDEANLTQTSVVDLDTTNVIGPLLITDFVYNGGKDGTLYAIRHRVDGSRIVQYDLKSGAAIEWTSEEDVTGLFPVQGKSGVVVRVQNKLSLWSGGREYPLLSNVINHGTGVVVNINNEYRCLLFADSQLYYNTTKVSEPVTSYICRNDGYLILTTIDDKLICLRPSDWEYLKCLDDKKYVQTRELGAGSVLINANPANRSIIMQTPRGDIEIINPRILAIDHIKWLLENKKYAKAYRVIHADRINLNIMYDLGPNLFLANVNEFVQDIKKCNDIDKFIFSLQDDNVTYQLYRGIVHSFMTNTGTTDNKRITIINTLISTMKQLDNKHYLQSIVTAYACKFDIEGALTEIQAMRCIEIKHADAVLNHLIVITSVENLYEAALGMDNMDLFMWIATKSNLDPMEYLPFLGELANMDDNFRRYKINKHIGRYEKALKYLLECDNESVMGMLSELIEKHEMHSLAAAYVRPENKCYVDILTLVAAKLVANQDYHEAGIMYYKAGVFKHAYECFIYANRLPESLDAICRASFDGIPNQDILRVLALRLADSQKYKEAADVHENYLQNYEEAINVCIKGELWSNAYWLAHKYNRSDIIVSELKPAVLSQVTALLNLFKPTEEEFTKLQTRLRIVRNKHLVDITTPHLIGDDAHGEFLESSLREFDLDSIASTISTRCSKSSDLSSTSSKKKKKWEKKTTEIKEGSEFENIAIIRRLHIMITDVHNLATTVNDACVQLLAFYDCQKDAHKLQSSFEKLIDLATKSINETWPNEMLNRPVPLTVEFVVLQKNLVHLETQYRFPPILKKINWKLNSLAYTLE